MKNIKTLILLLVFNSQVFGQGSGSTLTYDGRDDYIQLASTINIGSGSSTVEMWVKVPVVGTGGLSAGERVGVLLGNYSSSPNVNYELHASGQCRMYWNFGQVNTYGTTDLRDNTWHHLAFVRDLSGGTNFFIYIDGILEHTETNTGSNITPTSAFRIGGDNRNSGGGPSFHGQIDEIRIWNIARSQTEIRDNMCQKLVGTEANLLHYYRFDNNSGLTLTDVAGGNNGTLTNMGATPIWSTSEAPIGDVSTHLYTGAWAGQTINLTSTDQGDMEIASVTGTPDGFHLYRVNAVPNSTTNISPALGSSDLYYGTFVVNGTAPTYSVEYDYTNYTDAIAAEPNLFLYNRDNNADNTWIDLEATVNSGPNTLTEPSLSSRGEYIIAGSINPLPIELINFSVTSINNEYVKLDWQTASEINNDYFTIERSNNGFDWEEVGRIDGAGNSTSILSYSTTDVNPFIGVSYYRLKQTDFDGQFEYSKIRSINLQKSGKSGIKIFPNPTDNQITILSNSSKLEQIQIYNVLGQNVTSLTKQIITTDNQIVINMFKLNKGIYYIKTETTANKLFKQ